MQSFRGKTRSEPPVQEGQLKQTPALDSRYISRELNSAIKWPAGGAPDALVNAITDAKTFKEAVSALKELHKFTLQNHDSILIWSCVVKALGSEPIAKLFAKSPSAAVKYLEEIINIGGENAWFLFKAMKDKEVAAMFANKPSGCIGYFRELSKISEEDSIFFLGLLKSKSVAKLFAKNPSELVRSFKEISRIAGDEACFVLNAMENKEVAAMFAKNPLRFTGYIEKLKNAAGSYSVSAFRLIGTEGVTHIFAKNPSKIIGLFKELDKIGLESPNVFFAVSHMQEAFEKDPSKVAAYMDLLSKYPPKDAAIIFLSFLSERELSFGSIADNPKAAERLIKNARNVAHSLNANYYSPEVVFNFAYAIDLIGEAKTRALYEEFGIEFFGRYSKETLVGLYNKIGGGNDARPVFLVAYTKVDPNGAYYHSSEMVEGLMKSKYYNTIIVEVESEGEFYDRVSKTSDGYFGIEAMIIGGHGSPKNIRLGRGGEEATLDLSDAKELKRLSNCFVSKPTIILESCSTGKDKDAIGAIISGLWGAKLFAPKVPTSIDHLETNGLGQVVGVAYKKESAKFEMGVEKPGKSKEK